MQETRTLLWPNKDGTTIELQATYITPYLFIAPVKSNEGKEYWGIFWDQHSIITICNTRTSAELLVDEPIPLAYWDRPYDTHLPNVEVHYHLWQNKRGLHCMLFSLPMATYGESPERDSWRESELS